MAKLPLSERPSFDFVKSRLRERIPQQLSNLFVEDFQNDCGCDVETYDSELSATTVYLSLEGIKEFTDSERTVLPMMPDICSQNIWDLLEYACQKAGNKFSGAWLSTMLYNSNSDIQKVINVYKKHFGPVEFDYTGEIKNGLTAPFVPENCVYFLPEPDCFGVISVNASKFGAFCYTMNIMRKEI
jgi:hypothetical protein